MRYLQVAAASGVPLVLASACSGGLADADGDGAAAAVIRVTPEDGAEHPILDKPITVTAQGGTLRSVSVTTKDGKAMAGVLSPDKTQWRSKWGLRPAAAHTVDATAVNPAGKATESRTTFTTVKPAKTFRIKDVTPTHKEKVGAGMPIMVTFDRPIRNKAEVERALEVQMSKPAEGAWNWVQDDAVHFRPRKYWPKGQRIKLVAHLAGVREGAGVYGEKNVVREFSVPRSQVSTINVRTHQMQVKRDGKKIRQIPISAGRSSEWRFRTTNGKHLAMEISPHVVMDSSWMGVAPGSPGGYRLDVYDTVRISDTGEYVHSAPWSVGSQGYANVSHGCVNASPGNARWFMGRTLRGDPINVTGSPRELDSTNGWGQWQVPWKKWLSGSALGASVNRPADVPTAGGRE